MMLLNHASIIQYHYCFYDVHDVENQKVVDVDENQVQMALALMDMLRKVVAAYQAMYLQLMAMVEKDIQKLLNLMKSLLEKVFV